MANADFKLRGRASRCCRGAEWQHLLMPLLLLLVAAAVDASVDFQSVATQEPMPTVSLPVATSEPQSLTNTESTVSSLAPSESNSTNLVRDGTSEPLSVTTDQAEHDSATIEKHDPDTSTANSVDSSVQTNAGIAHAPIDSSESTSENDLHSALADSTVPSLAASESMFSAVTQAEGTQRTLELSTVNTETAAPTVVDESLKTEAGLANASIAASEYLSTAVTEDSQTAAISRDLQHEFSTADKQDPDTSTTTVADFGVKEEAGSTVASIASSESVSSSAAGEDSLVTMTEQTFQESSPTTMVPIYTDLVTSDLITMLQYEEATTRDLSTVATSNAVMPLSPMDSVSGSHEATTGSSETAEHPVGSTDLSMNEIQTGDSATTAPSVSVTPLILDDVMQTSLTILANASTLIDNVIDTVDRTSTMTDDPSKTATTTLTVTGVVTNPDQRKDLPSEVKEEIVITRISVAKDIDINDVRNNFTTYLKMNLKTVDDADQKKRGRRQAAPNSEAQADINVQYTAIREVAHSEANWELEYYATLEGKIIPANVLISASQQAAKEYVDSTGGKVLSYYGTQQKWTPDPRTSPDREFHDNSGYVKAILGIIGALVGLVSIAVVAVWLVNRRRTKSFSFTKSIVDAESGYKLSGVENPVMANEILVESSRAEELSSKPALSTNGHASLDKVDDEAMIIPLDQLQAEVKI